MKIAEDTQAKIRERAYHIWEGAGRPHGRADEHWFQAMQEVFASPPMTTPDAKAKAKKPAAKKTTTVAKTAVKKTAKSPA